MLYHRTLYIGDLRVREAVISPIDFMQVIVKFK